VDGETVSSSGETVATWEKPEGIAYCTAITAWNTTASPWAPISYYTCSCGC